MLRLQLSRLNAEPGFEKLRDRVKNIAEILEEKATIPMVREQLVLIQEIQADEYWQDITVPTIETARKRLRALVKLIEKAQRKPIYTDFEDELGTEAGVELPGFGSGTDFERFRAKARRFLREHEDHVAINKLRMNKPLTPSDLAELERMLIASGVGGPEDLAKAKQESLGLGVFVRSLVGLDRKAAVEAFGRFLTDKTLRANQIEFIDMVVEHLVEHGVMDADLLYESPYTDLNPLGVDGVFPPQQVDALIGILKDIRQRSVA
jgi:type I restriction enzyme R subunit